MQAMLIGAAFFALVVSVYVIFPWAHDRVLRRKMRAKFGVVPNVGIYIPQGRSTVTWLCIHLPKLGGWPVAVASVKDLCRMYNKAELDALVIDEEAVQQMRDGFLKYLLSTDVPILVVQLTKTVMAGSGTSIQYADLTQVTSADETVKLSKVAIETLLSAARDRLNWLDAKDPSRD